jgi:hypothetical protein
MFKNYNIYLLFIVLAFIITLESIQAQTKPIQIALITPVQLVPEDSDIRGIRFNLIYGRNTSVTGIDGGFINHSTNGLSTGLQFGFIGLVDSDFTGWQDNSFNITRGNHIGVQAGIFNSANKMEGLQFGLVNYAVNMKGIQIGLLNIIKQGGTFPVFPIVNWSF